MGKLFCERETVICICKVCKSKRFVLDPLRKAKEYSRQRFSNGANDLQRGLRLEVAALKKNTVAKSSEKGDTENNGRIVRKKRL